MAEKIAGIPRKYAIVGVAAAVGIIGYAWWKNGQEGSATVAEEPLEAAVDEYDSPLGNSGTNSSLTSTGNVDESRIDTNAKWTQAAVEYLQGAGYDGGTVVSTLGKYLAFKPLSAIEAQIVMAARAAVGEPPVGGPYPIKDALPTPTTPAPITKKAPSGVKASVVNRTSIKIDWDVLSNVKGYVVYVNGVRNRSVVYSESTHTNLKPNTVYKFSVSGLYAGDIQGPQSATISVRTKK